MTPARPFDALRLGGDRGPAGRNAAGMRASGTKIRTAAESVPLGHVLIGTCTRGVLCRTARKRGSPVHGLCRAPQVVRRSRIIALVFT
jgi:hypothetical protein